MAYLPAGKYWRGYRVFKIKGDGGEMREDAEKLECAWCGSDSELYRTKMLCIDQIICKECMAKQDEELGIEWESEE